jgi:hypothetical protein
MAVTLLVVTRRVMILLAMTRRVMILLAVTRRVMILLAVTLLAVTRRVMTLLAVTRQVMTRQLTILWPQQPHQVVRQRRSASVALTKTVHSPVMTVS